jgi:hypothetical protein
VRGRRRRELDDALAQRRETGAASDLLGGGDVPIPVLGGGEDRSSCAAELMAAFRLE